MILIFSDHFLTRAHLKMNLNNNILIIVSVYIIINLSSFPHLVDCKEVMCPSLSPPEGVRIKCTRKPVVRIELKGNKNVTDSETTEHDCLVGSLPKTTAEFSCLPFYTSSNPEDMGGWIKCNKKGKWRNLKRFRKYSCHLHTRGWIEKLINENKIVIFGKSYCRYCKELKQFLYQLKQSYHVIEMDYLDEVKANQVREILYEMTGMKTWPNVFVNKIHVGGLDDTYDAYYDGRLQYLLSSS